MKIDIIIPNYNGSHLISKNLSKVLEAHKKYTGKIIIVDDGSNLSDKQELRRFVTKLSDKKVKLIEHIKNKGFSSAINTGVNDSNAEYVVLLNSDVTPYKNFLESLVAKMDENLNLFGIGCMDESVEGNSIVLRGRGIGYWQRGMVLHKKGDNNEKKTFWISGGSSIMRREIFNKLGGMDTLFNPFYWEDIDLSYRAMKAGYTIEFDRDSKVKHYHDEGVIRKTFNKSKVNRIVYRNQLVFIWKNITSTHLIVNHLLYIPIHLGIALIHLDTVFLAGFFLALIKLPAIIRKRNKQKKLNKVSDVSILGYIS